MSAAEVIELIKKLPPEEQAEVIAFAKNVDGESRVEEPKLGFLPQAEAEFRAERIFRENHELFRRLAQ
jgi:hypothetical protein